MMRDDDIFNERRTTKEIRPSNARTSMVRDEKKKISANLSYSIL